MDDTATAASAHTSAPPPEWEADEGLRPAVQAVLRQWHVSLAALVFVVALGGWYIVTIPSSYIAGAILSFEPRPDSLEGENMASLLVERYPEVVASTGSVQRAATVAGVSGSDVRGGLLADIASDTLNLTISVQLPTEEQAVAAAVSLQDSVLRNNESDPNLQAVVVSPAYAWGPAGVSSKLLAAGVLFVAVVVAFLVGLGVDALRRQP